MFVTFQSHDAVLTVQLELSTEQPELFLLLDSGAAINGITEQKNRTEVFPPNLENRSNVEMFAMDKIPEADEFEYIFRVSVHVGATSRTC